MPSVLQCAIVMQLDLRYAAEAAQLLADRRETDGLIQIVLFGHQHRFVTSEKSEAWLFGANRSGKSEALCVVAASFARFGTLDPSKPQEDPFRPKRIWLISLTYDMSRTILQPKLFQNGYRIDPRPQLIPDEEIESWNQTFQTLRLKNGSVVIFKSCDGGASSFQGAEVDLAGFDEVPDQGAYDETTIRVGAGRRLLIRGAATILPPPGVAGGVSWMFGKKARPWLELGTNEAERNAKSPTIDIFTAGIRHNPQILPEEIARLETRFLPGTPEHRIRLDGELLPSVAGALCYPGFRRSYHVNPTLSRNSIVPTLPLCLSVDFNPSNGVWTIGQRQGRVFRILDEITLEQSDIASMTYEFRSRVPAHQAELFLYGDATGRRLEGQTGTSSFHLLHQYLSGYPVPIRFMLPDVNPLERDRVDAVNLQLGPPTGERLFEIAPHCERTIADLEESKWTAKAKIDKTSDHRDGADCVGYWLAFANPTHRGIAVPATLRTIKSPTYLPGRRGAFPAARSNYRIMRSARQWFPKAAGVSR